MNRILSAALALFALAMLANAQEKRPSPDPGVTPVRMMDRAEVRVTRVEIEGGAVRSTHTHDDVAFHLFIPVSGKFELTIASKKPVIVNPGEVVYIEKSTPHGFRNLASTKGIIMEVFVKPEGTKAAGGHESFDLAQVLAMVAKQGD